MSWRWEGSGKAAPQQCGVIVDTGTFSLTQQYILTAVAPFRATSIPFYTPAPSEKLYGALATLLEFPPLKFHLAGLKLET